MRTIAPLSVLAMRADLLRRLSRLEEQRHTLRDFYPSERAAVLECREELFRLRAAAVALTEEIEHLLSLRPNSEDE